MNTTLPFLEGTGKFFERDGKKVCHADVLYFFLRMPPAVQTPERQEQALVYFRAHSSSIQLFASNAGEYLSASVKNTRKKLGKIKDDPSANTPHILEFYDQAVFLETPQRYEWWRGDLNDHEVKFFCETAPKVAKILEEGDLSPATRTWLLPSVINITAGSAISYYNLSLFQEFAAVALECICTSDQEPFLAPEELGRYIHALARSVAEIEGSYLKDSPVCRDDYHHLHDQVKIHLKNLLAAHASLIPEPEFLDAFFEPLINRHLNKGVNHSLAIILPALDFVMHHTDRDRDAVNKKLAQIRPNLRQHYQTHFLQCPPQERVYGYFL